MKKIFFPGSFNPFTKGHADILERLLKLADTVTIGIGINIDKPASKENASRNAQLIASYLKSHDLDDRVDIDIYSCLTAMEANRLGAQCIARGVRTAADYDYEFSLASINREAFGVETILIPADPALSFVSSTMIRDLRNHDRADIADMYVP